MKPLNSRMQIQQLQSRSVSGSCSLEGAPAELLEAVKGLEAQAMGNVEAMETLEVRELEWQYY